VTVVVATCGAALRPEIARAWGPALSADGAQLTLCVEAPPGSAAEANLAEAGLIAATLTRPTTYSSVQLKGVIAGVRPPSSAELERAAAHVEGFVAEVAALGLDQSVSRRVAGDCLLTVVVAVAERYDQTPGSGAGARL